MRNLNKFKSYNYVIIFENIVPEKYLSNKNNTFKYSEQGWTAVLGQFNLKEIIEEDVYPINSNWRKMSGWKDKLL